MKKLLVLIPLLCAAALVHADLVIEQKIESSVLNGNTITKIKGDLMRVDMPMPGGLGQASTIIDLTKGKSTTLMHAQKMAMQMDLGPALKQAQAMLQAQGKDAVKPKATGQSEKIGAWNADVYEYTAGGFPVKIWVSKDIPNADAIRAQMKKLTSALPGGAASLAQFDIPGVPVKTELTLPQGKMITTMTSLKDTPVADSEFTIPADYQTMALPAGGDAAAGN
jgi:Domain of unknown function (DUF4412)